MNVELDIDAIKKKFKTNKKVVCFGAGTAGKLLLEKLPSDYQISYFTDNNEKIWGQNIKNVEIINPQEILAIENVFVIIISRHVLPIKQQLKEYGLQEEADFIDIYSEFEKYFYYAKAIELAEEYLKFASSIDKDLLTKQVGDHNHQKIGITVLGEMSVQKMLFQITMYLILKIKKYNVELILDFIGDFADIKYFDGANWFLKELIAETLDKLEPLVGKIQYVWLNEESCELSDNDNSSILINVRDTAKSYCAYIGHKKDADNFYEEKVKRIEREITKHLMSLKTFMLKKKYDIVSVISGLIDRRWDYTYLGHSYGIRVPSYDMDCWSTDYPACWNYDLRNNLILNKKELDIYAQEGKILFNERKMKNKGITGFKQLVNYTDCDSRSNYDILIPLNVMFDGAVLGLDKIFTSPEEWIFETVQYLYENTNTRILIRESPVSPPLASLNYSNYSQLLKKYIDNKRVFYSDRDEKVNIYKLIENSKVILPYTSTIGIEAAIMDKPVIVHTHCFYENEKFVINSDSKSEYFQNIEKFIKEDKYVSKSKERALAFFYVIHSKKNKNVSLFCEGEIDWIYNNFQSVCQYDVISNMVNVIAENKMYFND